MYFEHQLWHRIIYDSRNTKEAYVVPALRELMMHSWAGVIMWGWGAKGEGGDLGGSLDWVRELES